MSIHLVLYANNEPFETTRQLTVDTVHACTARNVVVHDFNIAKIKQKEWFRHLDALPLVDRLGKRDGYYNAWKAFIVRDVYEEMAEGDILYYVDCSQYFKAGFTENMDKLCDLASDFLRIAGSVSADTDNRFMNCCGDLLVWNKIIPSADQSENLKKMHVLNSWFLFKKCSANDAFIDDWVRYTVYTDDDARFPLVTYHHTGDQSIFNILVSKYNFHVLFLPCHSHYDNKDKNLVLRAVNESSTRTFLICQG